MQNAITLVPDQTLAKDVLAKECMHVLLVGELRVQILKFSK